MYLRQAYNLELPPCATTPSSIFLFIVYATVGMWKSEHNLQEWVLETECGPQAWRQVPSTMLSQLASLQSILEPAQKQLSHRAHAYHAKALGLAHPQC